MDMQLNSPILVVQHKELHFERIKVPWTCQQTVANLNNIDTQSHMDTLFHSGSGRSRLFLLAVDSGGATALHNTRGGKEMTVRKIASVTEPGYSCYFFYVRTMNALDDGEWEC